MKAKGFTLPEMVVAVSVFAAVAILVGTLFVVNERLYATSSAQVNVMSSNMQGIGKLRQELQESDFASFAVSVSPNAVIFASARNSSGQFQIASSGANAGKPWWQKWVCYYLISQPGSSWFMLVRKEGSPPAFPSANSLPQSGANAGNTPPAPPAAWLSNFQSYNAQYRVIAQDVQSLSFLASANPVYFKWIAESDYGGIPTTYNSGVSETGNGCCWIQVKLNN